MALFEFQEPTYTFIEGSNGSVCFNLVNSVTVEEPLVLLVETFGNLYGAYP